MLVSSYRIPSYSIGFLNPLPNVNRVSNDTELEYQLQ